MVAFGTMTWNVENLFAPGSGAEERERDAYGRKLGLLASVIGEAGPDVVALQENGGEDALRDLGEALGGDYPHGALSAFPDRRGIRVAFLSRHALKETEDLADFPPGPALEVSDLTDSGGSEPVERMGRGALRVRVRKEGLAVDLLTAHLKSKLLSFPRPWGTSFAPQRRRRAGPGRWRGSAPPGGRGRDGADQGERAAREPGGSPGGARRPQRRARGANLPALERPARLPDRLGGLRQARPGGRLPALQPGAPDPRGAALLAVHEGRGELLDQILVSEELLPAGEDGQRRVPEADALVDFREGLPSVGSNPAGWQDDVAPDHAPVVAALVL